MIQRSASYNLNPYDLDDLSGYTCDETWTGTRYYIVSAGEKDLNGDGSYHLYRIKGQNVEQEYPNLDKVILGDIVYYRGYHVMMVAAVEYEPGSRSTSVERIHLIEATTNRGWDIHFVANQNTLKSYNEGNMQRNWVLGRLK